MKKKLYMLFILLFFDRSTILASPQTVFVSKGKIINFDLLSNEKLIIIEDDSVNFNFIFFDLYKQIQKKIYSIQKSNISIVLDIYFIDKNKIVFSYFFKKPSLKLITECISIDIENNLNFKTYKKKDIFIINSNIKDNDSFFIGYSAREKNVVLLNNEMDIIKNFNINYKYIPCAYLENKDIYLLEENGYKNIVKYSYGDNYKLPQIYYRLKENWTIKNLKLDLQNNNLIYLSINNKNEKLINLNIKTNFTKIFKTSEYQILAFERFNDNFIIIAGIEKNKFPHSILGLWDIKNDEFKIIDKENGYFKFYKNELYYISNYNKIFKYLID